MPTSKIAITLDVELVEELDRLVAAGRFPSRSRAIQEAVQEKLARLRHGRLAREAAKLDRETEQRLADEGLTGDAAWPEY